MVREAAKKPTASLKELQQLFRSTGCPLHMTTISWFLHVWATRKDGKTGAFFTKQNKKLIQAQLHFLEDIRSSKAMWNTVLWSDKTNIELKWLKASLYINKRMASSKKDQKVLERTNQSPDVNPTEHLQGDLKRAVYRRRPVNELESFCKEECQNISYQEVQN